MSRSAYRRPKAARPPNAQENDLIVIRDPGIAAFEAHFERMWDGAQPMTEFEPHSKRRSATLSSAKTSRRSETWLVLSGALAVACDKIAASKKKGMWMGGQPSLGYDVKERKLVVNEAEAATVRYIFRRYLELETVRALRDDLAAAGVVSKRRSSQRRRLRDDGSRPENY